MKILRIFALLSLASITLAQSGGTYQLEKSVIASGGATSSGGTYSLESTTGQPVASGALSGESLQLFPGFWTPAQLPPTAASATVSGRVVDRYGRGINGAVLSLTNDQGRTRMAITNTFGYFRFTDVRAGEGYVMSVAARRHTFAEPSRFISVFDNITDLKFTGERR